MSPIDYLMWYMLIFFGIVFMLSGIDDLFFDFGYWFYYFFRLWKTRKYKKLTYDDLNSVPQKSIALIVACWQEQLVINKMVEYNLENIDYANYDIFIGVYPNDEETLKAAREVAAFYKNVHCVVNTTPGPTNKADNLNSVYRYIVEFEKKNATEFNCIIMHDPEDVIHPLSFKLYNYLIPRKQMIQTPVFPLEVNIFNWTHWAYNDEFAELHTKDLVVREAVKGFVPSAGVGTAFDRNMLKEIAFENKGAPFDTKTFTEDYSSSLRLQLDNHLKKRKAIFLLQSVIRVKKVKPWYFFGVARYKKVKEYIATRSLFPTNYVKAVKQRTRWSLGIVFQEWQNSGWPGNWTIKYLLFHDRKAFITHFLGGFGYVIFLYWMLIYFYSLYDPKAPTLAFFLNAHPWTYFIIIICSGLMFDRVLQRFIATFRIYGFLPAILSIPRIFYINLINMNAIFNAYVQFFSTKKKPGKLKWDKTVNRFPPAKYLEKYQKRLGDILVRDKMIKVEELIKTLEEQKDKGGRLGELLLKNKMISENQLLQALAEEYNLNMVENQQENILKADEIPQLVKESYWWLIAHQFRPIQVNDSILTLAIANPGIDLKFSDMVKEKVYPLHVKYVLTLADQNPLK